MAPEPRARKKSYSNSYRTLEAVWQVLREHSSPQHPLTVREICGHLEQLEGPSQDTLKRLLSQNREVMDLLFSGRVLQEGVPPPAEGWLGEDGLHIVVETSEGRVLSRDSAGLEVTCPPLQAPSYSTVHKLLKQVFSLELRTFPYALRCVAQVSDWRGRVRLVPYEQWEDRQESRGQQEENNNMPRRYYLECCLTDAEWRMFSDLVLVYPYLSEAQTRRFLQVLNRLRPRPVRIPTRFAYKRGSPRQMEIIALLDQAIWKRKKVRLQYGEYRLEQRGGSWTPVLHPRRHNSELEVEPYALMWSNGYYYLAARHRGMMNLRADRILAVELLPERFTLPPDFDPVRYRNSCPVMYPGQNRFVRLRCKTSMLNTLLDFFGELPQYSAPQDGPRGETTELTMSIAPAGVKLFALQYAGSVEVLEPEDLRQEVAQALEEALELYRS